MEISCALLSRPIEQASQAQAGALRPSEANNTKHAKKRLHLCGVVVVPSVSREFDFHAARGPPQLARHRMVGSEPLKKLHREVRPSFRAT